MDAYSQSLAERLEAMAQAIARLERKTDFILSQLQLTYIDNPEGSIPPELAEVYTFLKQGKRLQAIQAYRKLTNANLDVAKRAVEKMELGQPPF